LFDRPSDAPDALTPQWVEDRLKSGSREDLLLAARRGRRETGSAVVGWMRTLLAGPDPEVQRVALLSGESAGRTGAHRRPVAPDPQRPN